MLCEILDVVLPPSCLGCGRLLHDPGAMPPLCARCDERHEPLPPELRRVRGIEALFAYSGPLADAVAALKYTGRVELAGPLGALLARAPCLERDTFDLITSVPLHPGRGLRRGFNQAELLARWLVTHRRRLGRRAPTRIAALRRVRSTAPQAARRADERARNVAGAFVVRRRARARLADARVLVVDDVTTTGATLGACLAALRAAGVRRAAGLALLRSTG